MRTSTAAWATALAVMSITGPFTTAKAAPARRVEQEQPRPIYGKLRKRQGFNDSDPDPLSVPSIPPLLGDSSTTTTRGDPTPSPDPSRSDPDPRPENAPLSLTSSTSRPAEPSSVDRNPDRSGDRPADSQDPPKPTRSDSNPADPLLSSLLRPTSDFTFSLAPPRVESSSSPQAPDRQRPEQSSSESASPQGPDRQRPDQFSSEPASSKNNPDNDPLLGSITGQLSDVLPDSTRPRTSSAA